MPTISAKVIKKPRTIRYCDAQFCPDGFMETGYPQVRLYGNGCNGDPKYTMYICLYCAEHSEDEKIQAAISKQSGGI